MMHCHSTQSATVAMFSAEIEQFRLAPVYDLRKLPNGGRIFYETRRWGMTGTRWIELTTRTMSELVGRAAA
jgi:hypothetical protein